MPSVLVTVLLALSVLGAIGWTLTRQLVTLADELPQYSRNIQHRISELRGASKGGSVDKVKKTVEDVVGEIQKTTKPDAPGPKPVPVVLEPPSILAHLPTLLQALASAVVVMVLTVFMLLERRELRDRVILLIGYRRVTVTTRAVCPTRSGRGGGVQRVAVVPPVHDSCTLSGAGCATRIPCAPSGVEPGMVPSASPMPGWPGSV